MARLNLQKFIAQAGESKIINLDLTMGELVHSSAFESLQAYDDPWEWFCGNDFRLIIWRPGGLGDIVINPELGATLRENLAITRDIKNEISHLRR